MHPKGVYGFGTLDTRDNLTFVEFFSEFARKTPWPSERLGEKRRNSEEPRSAEKQQPCRGFLEVSAVRGENQKRDTLPAAPDAPEAPMQATRW